MSAFLPDEPRVSEIRLRTADLERALRFYTGPLGLRLVERTGNKAAFSARESGRPLIVLEQERSAVARAPAATGLYHLALRYPTRRDLAHALERLWRSGHAIQGASDHL